MSESVKHQAVPQLRVYRRRKGEAKGFTWSDYRDLIIATRRQLAARWCGVVLG